jgi:hypothetical protein
VTLRRYGAKAVEREARGQEIVRKCGATAREGEAQRDSTQAAERAQFVEKAVSELSITKRSPSSGV